MFLRKRRLLYPLGLVLVGGTQYLSAVVATTMDEMGQREDEAIASTSELIGAKRSPVNRDPVTAAWKGMGYWTALYSLVRFVSRRPATAKRLGVALLKSSIAFNVGFFGTTQPLARSYDQEYDEGDAGIVGAVGLMAGTATVLGYHLVRWRRRHHD